MNRLHALTLLLFLAVSTMKAQAPLSNGKPTEQVVIQYEKLVSNGAFLTPKGWKRAGKLYSQSTPFPRNGEISLMTVGGSLGESWVRGDKAQVETKWTDFLGTIDSALRYKPPDDHVTMTAFVFHLVYTNKHSDIGKNGETVTDATGAWEWKIEAPQVARWATVERAIEYVAMMRDKTENASIKRNADKTIAALKRLRSGGSACAC